MIFFGLKDPRGGNKLKIDKKGQITAVKPDFSTFYFASLAVDNTHVNVVEPKSYKFFVITDIILSGTKDVGVDGSVVQIYASNDGPATATVTDSILTITIARSGTIPLSGLNIKVEKGRWINAVCDDNIVSVNIAGYYQNA